MRQQDDLINTLQSYEAELDEIKARQFAGSSNVVGYYNETNNTWDMDWTPSSVGGMGYAQRMVTVRFTALNKPAAFTAIEMDAFFNSTRYTNELQPYIYQIFDRQISSDIDVAQFEQASVYIVQADTTQRIQLKFRAASVDIGNLQVSWVTDIGS